MRKDPRLTLRRYVATEEYEKPLSTWAFREVIHGLTGDYDRTPLLVNGPPPKPEDIPAPAPRRTVREWQGRDYNIRVPL